MDLSIGRIEQAAPAPDDAVCSGINKGLLSKTSTRARLYHTNTDEGRPGKMSTTTARLERRGLKVDEVIRHLDGFYCYNVAVSLWADAVANRLEGPALYLLADELAEVAHDARAAAAKLAARIGDLGGAVTADPRELADRFPGDFTVPANCADPAAILAIAAPNLATIIEAYDDFLDLALGKDHVSHHLVTKLLGQETHRLADLEAARAGGRQV